MNFAALPAGGMTDGNKLLIGIAIALAVAIAWRLGMFKSKPAKPIFSPPLQGGAGVVQHADASPSHPPAGMEIEDLLLAMQRRDDRNSDARLLDDRKRGRENESLAKALQRRQEPAK